MHRAFRQGIDKAPFVEDRGPDGRVVRQHGDGELDILDRFSR